MIAENGSDRREIPWNRNLRYEQNGIGRPGYYDRKNAEIQHIAEVIVAKQRNGDTPTIMLDFDRKSGVFNDPEEQNERRTA